MRRFLFVLGLALAGVWPSITRGQIYPPSPHKVDGKICYGYLEDVPKIDNSEGQWHSRGLGAPEVINTWDASNVDAIKDNLMPSMYKRVKERGLVLLETKYIPWTPLKDWVEATKQYAPSVELGADGYIVGYKAGVPFPVDKRLYGDAAQFDINDPQQGLKLINNQDYRWSGDQFFMLNDIYITDSRGGQRRLSNTYSRWRLEGRVLHDPKPIVPDADNPEGLRFIEIAQVTFPFELAGLFSLQHSFKNRHKEDNFWLYIPSLRRVRRASAAQRLDSFAGTDLAYEDFMGFNGFLGDFTYKVTAMRDTYIVRRQPWWPKMDVANLQNNPLYVERVPNAIWYEQYPKSKDHIYSKRLFIYDPEMDENVHWEAYDRKGELWKSFVFMWRLPGEGLNDRQDGFPYMVNAEIIDYLSNHSTLWPIRHEGFLCDLGADYYALERMQARGR